jgi:transposase
MILAVLLDGDGRPVCSEMWPGNTADVTTVIPVIDRLRRRFDITRVCVVADRGMISAETIAELNRGGCCIFWVCANAPISWCANWCSTIRRRSCRS